MKTILDRLFSQFSLTEQEAYNLMLCIGKGKINDAQITACMSAYRLREITLEELRGFRNALFELAVPVDIESENATDMCGTGGDGRNTYNISTLACFVVAAAGGRVIKHGNYGVSSVSGSSTVLEKLGYRFTNNPSDLAFSLEKTGICFLHAPLFQPALKNVAEARRNLGVRTFFNVLGPLVNPAKPSHRLTGVYDAALLRKYKYLLEQTDEQFVLVNSQDGFDEISLTAPAVVSTRCMHKVYTPRELSLQRVNEGSLFGGHTTDEAAEIFLTVLNGKGTTDQVNVVAVNAGFALANLGVAEHFSDGIARAKEMLVSGAAYRTFKRFMEKNVSVN